MSSLVAPVAAIDIHTQCHVNKLITVTQPSPIGERVVGVEYTNPTTGTAAITADAVVLTTGGFAYGQVSNSLLSKWTPWLDGLPCTNGPFAIGEGVTMAEKIGANLVDMTQVQVHPTGFVDPHDPANPVKFLGERMLLLLMIVRASFVGCCWAGMMLGLACGVQPRSRCVARAASC